MMNLAVFSKKRYSPVVRRISRPRRESRGWRFVSTLLFCGLASLSAGCEDGQENQPQDVAEVDSSDSDSSVSDGPEHEPGLLSDDVARFIPPGVSPEDLFPSFALVEPKSPSGPVPDGWGPAPEFTRGSETYVADIAISSSTDLYGTGEIAGPLRRNGAVTEAWTEMPNPTTGDGGLRFDDTYDHLYQAHPWVLAVRDDGTAFGVLADTTRRTEMDLTDSIRFEAPAAFPVIVIQGENPTEVLSELADLTGHLDMPPRWALGHQQSRFSYADAEAMRGIAEDLRDYEIPTDVIWLDGAYMPDYKLFEFDEEAFPDPTGLITDLQEMDFHIVPIFDPGVRPEEGFALYEEAIDQDLLLKSPDGTVFEGLVWGLDSFAFPDFSQRATREWWTQHMGDFVETYNFDGIWVDLNEPVIYEVVTWYPPETLIAKGDDHYPPGTHAEYHNVYALQQLEATEAAFREAHPDQRPFILTRSNYIGGQRHAATWTGDNTASWDHLHWSISMLANMGMSGQPFVGADIGGFFVAEGKQDAEDPWDSELFAHWIGIGAFYPFCRNHSAGTDDAFTASFGGPTHHAWDFGPEIEQTYREAVERRYRLMPYLYTLFRDAAENGTPVFRPVFFAAPGEARLRGEDRAFLFGPDLLIVPQWPDGVLEDDSTLELPDGFEHEMTLVGEDPDTDPAHPRIRIRNGAIVPAGVVAQTTEYDPTSRLDLYLALDDDGKASGTLYEDSGEGYEYLDGEYREIALTAETVGTKVVVTLERENGELELPTRTLRAHLHTDDGVTTGEGTTDRVEIEVGDP
jgi:alpha-glucosidase